MRCSPQLFPASSVPSPHAPRPRSQDIPLPSRSSVCLPRSRRCRSSSSRGAMRFRTKKKPKSSASAWRHSATALQEHVDRAAIAAPTRSWRRSFKGGRLTLARRAIGRQRLSARDSPVRTLPGGSRRSIARSFQKELTAVLSDFASLETAEFLVTAIEVTRDASPSALTTIRFDLVGPAKGRRARATRRPLAPALAEGAGRRRGTSPSGARSTTCAHARRRRSSPM